MKASYLLYQKISTERGLSSYAVALKAGVPQSALSLWKNKGIVPKFANMTKIAAALSTPEHQVNATDFYAADLTDQGE